MAMMNRAAAGEACGAKRPGLAPMNDAARLLSLDPCRVVEEAGDNVELRRKLLNFADSLKGQVQAANAKSEAWAMSERERKAQKKRLKRLESGACLNCGRVEEDESDIYRCECFNESNGARGEQLCYRCHEDFCALGEACANCDVCGDFSFGLDGCLKVNDCDGDNCHKRLCEPCEAMGQNTSAEWITSKCGISRRCPDCRICEDFDGRDEVPKCTVCGEYMCGEVGTMARDGAAESHPCGMRSASISSVTSAMKQSVQTARPQTE